MCASCDQPYCSVYTVFATVHPLLYLLPITTRVKLLFRVTNRTLSLIVRTPSFYTRFLLCNLRVAAVFAALSLAMRFCDNTSLCAITAPFAISLKALAIEVSELSTCLSQISLESAAIAIQILGYRFVFARDCP
jgi:hypothetical protein